jgi:hypothetical protein
MEFFRGKSFEKSFPQQIPRKIPRKFSFRWKKCMKNRPQIGRIFAYWAIVYFGGVFLNYASSPNVFGTFPHVTHDVLVSQKWVGVHFWAIFFTNSSGHPAWRTGVFFPCCHFVTLNDKISSWIMNKHETLCQCDQTVFCGGRGAFYFLRISLSTVLSKALQWLKT